jgi:sirohydrochlorin ferrochelatase
VHVLDESQENTGHTAVVLLGHGSRAAEANEAMYEVVRRLQMRWPALRLSAAFLEINTPSIPEGIDFHAEDGAGRIILLPYFLHLGNHVQRDLPGFMEEGRLRHPHVDISLSDHLGFHPKLVDIAEERLIASLPDEGLWAGANQPTVDNSMGDYPYEPVGAINPLDQILP